MSHRSNRAAATGHRVALAADRNTSGMMKQESRLGPRSRLARQGRRHPTMRSFGLRKFNQPIASRCPALVGLRVHVDSHHAARPNDGRLKGFIGRTIIENDHRNRSAIRLLQNTFHRISQVLRQVVGGDEDGHGRQVGGGSVVMRTDHSDADASLTDRPIGPKQDDRFPPQHTANTGDRIVVIVGNPKNRHGCFLVGQQDRDNSSR